MKPPKVQDARWSDESPKVYGFHPEPVAVSICSLGHAVRFNHAWRYLGHRRRSQAESLTPPPPQGLSSAIARQFLAPTSSASHTRRSVPSQQPSAQDAAYTSYLHQRRLAHAHATIAVDLASADRGGGLANKSLGSSRRVGPS